MEYFIRTKHNYPTIENAEKVLKHFNRKTITHDPFKVDFYPPQKLYKLWVPIILIKIVNFIFFTKIENND